MRIGSDGDGGDTEDGAEVRGIGEVVKGEVALLLPCHRDDDVGGEEALVGIDEFGAGFGELIVTAGVEVDHLHGAVHVAAMYTVAGCFERRLGNSDDALLLGLGWIGSVGEFGRCGVRERRRSFGKG